MKKAIEAGVTAIPLKMRSGIDLIAAWKAFSILAKYQVHIVHTHSSVDGWCCGLAGTLAGIPVVRSRHLSTPISKSPLSYFVYMMLADRVVTSGQAIRKTMINNNRMHSDRIVSVPAGIDT